MLDVARHYQPVEFIYKYLDLMAIHKLNRFHLHLTDSKAWRVEIKKYPELALKTAHIAGSGKNRNNNYPKPMYYTQDELREIVAYAAERHIVVIPEIDIPGHSRAAMGVHPEWSCGGDLSLQDVTINAYREIFKELTEVFPGPYIHVGGDEVRAQWLKSPADLKVVEKNHLPKDNGKIQEWLQGQITGPMRTAGRRPVMWFMEGRWKADESTVSKDTIIMSWFTVEDGLDTAKAGYDVVINPKHPTYFDYRIQRDSPIPCISLNTLKMAYEWDPLPAGRSTPKQQSTCSARRASSGPRRWRTKRSSRAKASRGPAPWPRWPGRLRLGGTTSSSLAE